MAHTLKSLVKKLLYKLGYTLTKNERDPLFWLGGIASLPIKSVIDIGANEGATEGQFAQKINYYFPQAHLYCFEPLKEPYEKLERWAKRRPAKTTVFNVALGDREESVQMFLHKNHSSSSSILETTAVNESFYPFMAEKEQVTVSMTTLDKIFEDTAQLERDILIKIDVQGFEEKVIAGGTKTFSAARAVILEIAIDPLYAGQASFEKILTQLRSLGFHYAGNLEQIVSPQDGHVIYFDAVFLK
jgi:FkbM family methyltransferase